MVRSINSEMFLQLVKVALAAYLPGRWAARPAEHMTWRRSLFAAGAATALAVTPIVAQESGAVRAQAEYSGLWAVAGGTLGGIGGFVIGTAVPAVFRDENPRFPSIGHYVAVPAGIAIGAIAGYSDERYVRAAAVGGEIGAVIGLLGDVLVWSQTDTDAPFPYLAIAGASVGIFVGMLVASLAGDDASPTPELHITWSMRLPW